MHNYYMFHGGNHYGNWSTARPDGGLGGPSSSENTVRYANGALLRSDGSRREPAFSLAASVHAVFDTFAAAVLGATPTVLKAQPNVYFLNFGDAVVFGVHACARWNACGDDTARVAVAKGPFFPFDAGAVVYEDQSQ